MRTSRHGRRQHSPGSRLTQRWTTVDGVDTFYRESSTPVPGRVMMHVHGFGLSGRYLLPTAERLADDFHTYVPDLPGFGRSGAGSGQLDVPDLADAAAAFLTDRNVDRVTLVGNSMGCPVICDFAYRYPERLDRAVLVSPAGGRHNQPLLRAVGQIARDGLAEPRRLLSVVVPDYVKFGVPSTVKLFQALTQYPVLDRLLELQVPTLAVIGNRDPLMPGPDRIRQVARLREHPVLLVVIDGAAHAINFSHPKELAHAIRLFMADRPLADDPESPGTARVYELHRGKQLPERGPDGASGLSRPDSGRDAGPA